MKKRIIAVMCIILSIGLLFGKNDTNASTKSALIYAGSENITGGKYTLGQKSRLRLNIKNIAPTISFSWSTIAARDKDIVIPS